jgi:hypothetical protein
LPLTRDKVRAHAIVQITLRDVATRENIARAAALIRDLMQAYAAIGAADMVIAYLPYQFIVDTLVGRRGRLLRDVNTLTERV